MNHPDPTGSAGCDQQRASGDEDYVVLLVDATQSARQHATGLKQEFARVVTTETIEDAFTQISTRDVDCIISEYGLPDGNGIQFLETLRVEYPSLPFVIWTDSGDETVASRAIAASVTDYVPKDEVESLDYGKFADRIRTTVSKKHDSPAGGVRIDTLQFVSDTCHELIDTDTTADSFRTVLKNACEFTRWDYGEVWVPTEERNQLTCAASYSNNDQFDAFAEITMSMAFQPDEGLPGRVWTSATPERVSDVTTVSTHQYLRTAAAEKAELKTAFGVPVRDEDSVEAIVVFYSTEKQSDTPRLDLFAKTVAMMLGAYVAHFHSEREEPIEPGAIQGVIDHEEHAQQLKRRERLYRELAENFPNGAVLVFDADLQYQSAHGNIFSTIDSESSSYEGKQISDVFDGETLRIKREMYEATLQGESRAREMEFAGRIYQVHTIPVRDENGNIEAGIVMTWDITDRKERERELEGARKRFQTLIEAAPDPILVADANTEEIIEANTAAAALRNEPQEEIVGRSIMDIHPGEEVDRYRAEFNQQLQREGTMTEFDDGSPIYFETKDGEKVPVSVSSGIVSLDDRAVVHTIFRDVSEQKRMEESLEGVNSAAREMLQAETDAEIAQIVVNVTTRILEVSGCALYLYDEQVGELAPVAYSNNFDEVLDELPRFSPGDGITWRVFAEQESAYFDDVRTSDMVYNPGTPIRSELFLPIGGHGVFIVGDTDIDAIDDILVETVETLAATTEAAFDRAERTQELRERERDSQAQAKRLKRVQELNEKIRRIVKAIVKAETPEGIKQIVCDSLHSLSRFDAVWVGEPNPATGEIDIDTTTGAPEQYLEDISLELEPKNTVPSVRAARNRETVVESNLAEDPYEGDWRKTGLLYGVRSLTSAPLIHNDVLYGVLTIYSQQAGSFDTMTASVLTELGELIGYALNTVNQQNALLGDGSVDFTFELTGTDDVFVEMASQLSSRIEIKNISTRSEDTFLVHFSVDGADEGQVRAVAEEMAEIREIELLSEDQPLLFEGITIGGCIASEIAKLGTSLQLVAHSESGCQCQVSIPQDQEVQTFMRYLKDRYPSIEVNTHHNVSQNQLRSESGLLNKSLTDRQREIVTTAYYTGYFDDPRRRTGVELAESLGISQSAISKQLRVAQNKLLSEILE